MTWKLPQWKMNNLDNTIMENAQPGKLQKMHTLENNRKPPLENARMEIVYPGKLQKVTPQKKTENAQLEYARVKNAHPGKCQNGNYTPWKMTDKSHPRK